MNKWVMGVLVLIAAVIGVYFLNPFNTATWDPRARLMSVTTYRIGSTAMAPTLTKGDLILVRTSAFMQKGPQRGDIAVFRYPDNRKITFIFRVVAVSGDHVDVKDRALYINGEKVTEPYLMPTTPESHTANIPFEYSVPDGHVFVLGDNRDNSRDSRYWGPVPASDLIGKATYIWMAEDQGRVGPIH